MTKSSAAHTTATRTVFSHHPECRVRETNLCTCRELISAEVRLHQIRQGWTKPRPKPMTRIDIWAGLIGIGYIIGRYIA